MEGLVNKVPPELNDSAGKLVIMRCWKLIEEYYMWHLHSTQRQSPPFPSPPAPPSPLGVKGRYGGLRRDQVTVWQRLRRDQVTQGPGYGVSWHHGEVRGVTERPGARSVAQTFANVLQRKSLNELLQKNVAQRWRTKTWSVFLANKMVVLGAGIRSFVTSNNKFKAVFEVLVTISIPIESK